MGYRTNKCSACGSYGHNRRGCPDIKAAYARVEDLAKKYCIERSEEERAYASTSWISRINEAARVANAPEDEVSWRDRWLWEEVADRKIAQAAKNKRVRHCGFCGKTGHNRRNCPEKEAHERECRAMKALAHRVARMTFEAAGIVPGALIQYREFDYITREYVDRVGLVQGIDWSQIGKQDVENSSGLGNVLEYWVFRGGKSIIIKDYQGRTENIAVPRNIEQQSDYFGNMHNQYKLICPVHGSRVNLDGYEGDNKFPVSMPVYMWGGKWMSKRFGNKVIKAIKEVGSELIVA